MIPMVLQMGVFKILQEADTHQRLARSWPATAWSPDGKRGDTRGGGGRVRQVMGYESRQRRVNRAETITMAPSSASYG
jgi:hypothetical protein